MFDVGQKKSKEKKKHKHEKEHTSERNPVQDSHTSSSLTPKAERKKRKKVHDRRKRRRVAAVPEVVATATSPLKSSDVNPSRTSKDKATTPVTQHPSKRARPAKSPASKDSDVSKPKKRRIISLSGISKSSSRRTISLSGISKSSPRRTPSILVSHCSLFHSYVQSPPHTQNTRTCHVHINSGRCSFGWKGTCTQSEGFSRRKRHACAFGLFESLLSIHKKY